MAEGELKEIVSNFRYEFSHFQQLNKMLELEIASLQNHLLQVGAVNRLHTIAPLDKKLTTFAKEAVPKHEELEFQSECQPESNGTGARDDYVLFPSSSQVCLDKPIENPSNRLVTAAFNDTEAEGPKGREEKVQNLVAWFNRLNVDGGKGLSIPQLSAIVERVHGYRGIISARSMHMLIAYLEKTNREHEAKTEKLAEVLDDIIDAHIDEVVLRFPIFADIILFDRIGDVDSKMYQDIVVLRDAIMRSHLDELVSQYAHIPIPVKTSSTRDSRIAHFMNGFESVVAFVILLNGVTIGISSDVQWKGWDTVDILFTAFFLFEIGLKVHINGAKQHLCGSDWRWNWFDVVVVALAVFDVVLTWMASFSSTTNDSSFKDFTLLRLARLARLTRMMRLIRVLRLRFFKELLLMVKGVLAGLRTLFWAIVMLVFLVYACGVLLRQTVGEQNHVMRDEYSTVLFGTVPWSMFSVFRCFMSDCNLADGTPIAEHLYQLYGFVFVIPYFVCLLFIIFGIFNMVTAVFVENVIEAARQRQLTTKEVEQMRVGKLLNEFVYQLASKPIIEGATDANRTSSISTTAATAASIELQPKMEKYASLKSPREAVKKLRSTVITKSAKDQAGLVCRQLQSEVKREAFLTSLQDPQVARLIDDLEIQIGNHSELFDAIDSDGSGSIDIGELIQGLMKMRSAETKQDVVALILGMRGMRHTMQDMAKSMLETNDQVVAIRQELAHVRYNRKDTVVSKELLIF